MTFKNDTKAADLLATAFNDILESDEHKIMFKKEAQWVGEKGTLPGSTRTDTGITVTDDPGSAGTGAMQSQVKPGAAPKGALVSGDVRAQLQAIVNNPALAGVGPNSDAAANLAGKILAGQATKAELSENSPAVKQLYSAIDKKTLGSQNSPQALALALEDINYGANKSAMASDERINILLKMASELDEEGFVMSEAIATNLIQSIIVEAKKKAKKEKKTDKKTDKLEKKTKKDMKCEECGKLPEKCKCE